MNEIEIRLSSTTNLEFRGQHETLVVLRDGML